MQLQVSPRKLNSTMSTTTESTCDKDSSISKSDNDSYLKPLIGLTAEQLKIAQQTTFWKFWRITVIVLFWLIWASMVAGAIVIIVVNNGDVPSTTTTASVRTTTL
ncbi:hypothetical protein Y032_0764g2152 [Ancylostoma ceylanicum]|uniref:Solute carrier family 3 member 2 N-terminal domain-containing protein n=1 Tax=Ancylostoma ceylanicum TaxID=53326 RepID=A0A016WEV3_9BILA|nr:hypothetical protein Y032_0764g2152 [Ancylostoma ceylanicum]